MWQRFTERAKTAVFFAQDETAKLGDNGVTTGHLLLGLIREEESGASQVLSRLGIAPDAVANEVRRVLQPRGFRVGVEMSLTSPAKVSIDRGYEEARALDNNNIGTEHLLLGIIAEEIGAGRVLVRLGADLDRVRAVVREMALE